MKYSFHAVYYYNRDNLMKNFGYPGYSIFCPVYHQSYFKLSDDEYNHITKFLGDNSTATNEPVNNLQKNILLIIVESLNSFLLNKNVEGHEITPFLNSIIRDSSSFFVPNIIRQVAQGNSSDGQLMINTGMLPIYENATCYLVDREYYSLASALKANHSYKDCVTILGHQSSLWNQEKITRDFHYDKLYSLENFKDISKRSNMPWINDMLLVECAERVIDTLKAPYQNRVCHLILSLSIYFNGRVYDIQNIG